MIDPDTNSTDPYSPALHTMYANVTASQGNVTWDVIVAFINPTPDTVAPHHYTMLLFNQPGTEFVVLEQYLSYMPLDYSDPMARENFPILDFIRDAKLGEPVAGTYFLEGESTTASSNAIPDASATGVPRNATATSTSNTASTSTSPPVVAQAAVSSASLGALFLGLTAVLGAMVL